MDGGHVVGARHRDFVESFRWVDPKLGLGVGLKPDLVVPRFERHCIGDVAARHVERAGEHDRLVGVGLLRLGSKCRRRDSQAGGDSDRGIQLHG
jgi:hypothetical protein